MFHTQGTGTMSEQRGKTKSILLTAIMVVMISSAPTVNAQDMSKASKVADVKVGELFEMKSKHLKETRKYSVSLPSSYDRSDAAYPLVVVLDGEDYFATAVGAYRFMAMNRLMPEAVVIGIHNTDRRGDMTPPDISLPDVAHRKGHAFLGFIEEELLPVLTSKYRLLPLRVLIGHSHGGLIAVYAISARPELFRWYLVVDAPLQLSARVSERRLLSYLEAHPRHTGRLISIERTFGWTDKAWQELERQTPKSFIISRMKMPGETHPTMFYPALYEGLKWLFTDIMFRPEILTSLSDLKTQYANLSAAYGYTVSIPRAVLQDAAEDQLMAGRPEEASALVGEVKKQFGPSPETKLFEEWIDVLRKRPLEETYDQVVHSAPPTEEQATEFLGTWEAVVQHHTPNKVEITFETTDGKVVARQREFDQSGNEVTPILGAIAYLRMKEKDTIEWGYMNGMRPRTMIISYTAKLDASGELKGSTALKAVSFSPDRTDNPDKPESFRFVRKR